MSDGWRRFERKTIFISCSSDMAAEAYVVRDVVAELNRRVPDGDRWDVYHWAESEDPWPASGTWQQFIPRAGDPNVGAVVCLFGERLGTPLPDYFALPADIVLPGWVAVPWDGDVSGGGVPLTGTLFELLDAVGAATPVLCYVKADAARFARSDLSAGERGYGFEQHYDALRGSAKRIRNRAREAEYDEQVELLDLFCEKFFRGGGRPWTCFGSEQSGPDGAREALRERLRSDLGRILGVPAAGAEPRALKGLAPFERADHEILFGRDRQIVRILDRLRTQEVPMLVLTGRSGEGKSSVVRAGLLGRLDHGRYFDYGAFAPVLIEGVQPDTRHQVAAASAALQTVPADRARRRRRLFIVVDQFEDVLLRDDDHAREELVALFAALRALAQGGLAWVVVSVSADHLQRLLRLQPGLAFAIETLQPPGRDDLVEIIERSFAAAGFDPVAEELAAVVAQADAWLARQADPGPVLPLLGALLAEIVQARNAPAVHVAETLDSDASPALTLDGVIDRLAERACERAYGRDTTWTFGIFPGLLRQLVTTGVTGAIGGFAIVRECVASHPAIVRSQPLVDALIGERLLYHPRPGVLRLVHVSVVEHWKKAAAWYAEDQRFQETLVHVERRAARWLRERAAGKPERRLVDIVDITEAFDLWSNWPDEHDRLPVEFMRASLDAWFRPATWDEQSQVSESVWGLFKALGTNDAKLIDAFFKRITELRAPVRRDIVNGKGSSTIPMFMAAYRANASAVRRLFEFGAVADVIDDRGRAPLHIATMFGSSDVVELLVRHGADAGRAGSDGVTPLMCAAGRGDARSAAILAERGVCIDQAESEGYTALLLAAENGHRDVVDVLLARGARIGQRHQTGATALMFAARSGHIDVVKCLLAHGAVVDDVEEHDGTALMLAAASGHRAVVTVLLAHGAAIDRLAVNGQTALSVAAEMGHAGVVTDLLDHGASVGRQAGENASVLFFACQRGNVEIVRALLAHGAPLDGCTSDGATVLDAAARNGHVGVIRELAAHGLTIEVAQQLGGVPLHGAAVNGQLDALRELLREGADVAYRREGVASALLLAAVNGRIGAMRVLLEHGAPLEQACDRDATALNAAVDAGQLEAVAFLLDRGADVEHVLDDGKTSLILAGLRGRAAIVRELLRHGADVEASDSTGATALIHAAFSGHADVANVLLENGAAVDHAMSDGNTALSAAAQGGHAVIVRDLLARGARIDVVDQQGTTPLMIAASNGRDEAVRVLLESGAPLEQLHESGMTALIVAANMGHRAVVRLLLEHGARMDHRMTSGHTPLLAAVLAGHVGVVEELLAHGGDVDEASGDGYGCTLLHNAALRAAVEMVRTLLAHGAHVDAEQYRGWTALMIAAEHGRADVARELLGHGAALEHRSHADDRTPLQVAAGFGHAEVARALLDAGASVDAQDRFGWTALFIAALNGHAAVVRLLLGAGADAALQARAENGETASPLEVAARCGHRDVVDVLLASSSAPKSDRGRLEEWLREADASAVTRQPPARE